MEGLGWTAATCLLSAHRALIILIIYMGRVSWKTWTAATCLLTAHTALIIMVIMFTCGSTNPHSPVDPSVNLTTPTSARLTGQAPTGINTNHESEETNLRIDHDTKKARLITGTGNKKIVAAKLNTNDTPVQVKTPDANEDNTEFNITKPTTNAPTLSDYLHNRETPINGFGYRYSTSNENICRSTDGKNTVFLLILCITKDYQKTRRDTIRATWGSIVNTQSWPRMKRKFTGVKLVFLVGNPPGHTSKYDTAIQNENDEYGDIVQADFVDNVQNASLKIILGLKWIREFCPGVKFVLRAGDDQFVHVANLVKFLEDLEVPDEGFVIGFNASRTTVARKGYWGINQSVYPFENYPAFVRKLSYVISGNIVDGIASDAQFIPYIFIEDAYITGVLRSALGASLVHNAGFATGGQPRPKLCGFHNEFRFTANTNPSLTMNLWKSLHRNLKNCYTPKR